MNINRSIKTIFVAETTGRLRVVISHGTRRRLFAFVPSPKIFTPAYDRLLDPWSADPKNREWGGPAHWRLTLLIGVVRLPGRLKTTKKSRSCLSNCRLYRFS